MTIMQYADGIYARSCKVTNVYKVSILNDNFLDGYNSLNSNVPRKYCGVDLQTDHIDITFMAQSLLAIRKKVRNHRTLENKTMA